MNNKSNKTDKQNSFILNKLAKTLLSTGNNQQSEEYIYYSDYPFIKYCRKREYLVIDYDSLVKIDKKNSTLQMQISPNALRSLAMLLSSLAEGDTQAIEAAKNELTKLRNELEQNDNTEVEKERSEMEDLANNALDKAKEYYEKMQAAEKDYDHQIKPIMAVFRQLMPDLACFAGCRREEDCHVLGAILENHCGHIHRYFELHPELPPTFPDSPFPYVDEPTVPQLRDLQGYVLSDTYQEVKGWIKRAKSYNSFYNADLQRYKTEIENGEKLLKQLESENWTYNNSKPSQDEEDVFSEASEILSEAKKYVSNGKKSQQYLLQHQKDWDYVLLLKRAFPLIQRIAGDTPPAGDTEALMQFARELDALLDDAQSEEPFKFVDFRWIMPDSPESLSSEFIRLDFKGAEASWPGLYCSLKTEPEKLICVIPGGVGQAGREEKEVTAYE